MDKENDREALNESASDPEEPQDRKPRLPNIVLGGPLPAYTEPETRWASSVEEENILLRAVLADLKVVSSNPTLISNRKKAEFGERLRQETGLPLRAIIVFLKISKSSYEYQRAKLNAPTRDDTLVPLVEEVFKSSRASYGYRRIWGELKMRGICVSEKVVRRIMTQRGLVARSSRRAKRWSSYVGEITDAPENLLLDEHKRHVFHAKAINQLWLTDVSEFKIDAGKLYLSALIDCFDGHIVASTISEKPNAEMANSMLENAVRTLSPGEKPVTHSDRGGHYRWPGWIAICEEAGLVRSMSRKGHSPDNAACEGLFGRMKVEMFYGVDWSFVTLNELKEDIERYVVFYNENRIKSFREGGKLIYDTILDRRKRLGLTA